LTPSSLQFAVAVGRNHTVKTPGTTNRTLCRPSGPTPTMQRMKLQAFGWVPKTVTRAKPTTTASYRWIQCRWPQTLHLRSQHSSRSHCLSIWFVGVAVSKPVARHHLFGAAQREYIRAYRRSARRWATGQWVLQPGACPTNRRRN